MADQVTNYQCPACTGPLRFDGKTGKLKCDYCGSYFTVQEVEKLYAAKNASAEKAKENADKAKENTDSGSGWGSDAAKMRAYNCTSCGAELICDETTAATQCPYCGNNTVIPGQFAGTLKPDCVIPFKYEKQDAVKALKGYYKGKTLLPGSFNNSNHLEEIKGVYVPFWLYSGHVDARGLYEARQDEVHRQGEYEITRSRHYEVSREGTINFSRVLAMRRHWLRKAVYRIGRPIIGCEQTSASRTWRAASDKHDYRNEIYNEKTEYAVLPVWLLSTKWQGQNFLFAMNGQTGKMIGNLPVSRAKQTIWFLAVFILSFLLFGSFLLTGEDVTAVSYLIAFIFAFVPAAIVNAVLCSQMKPVAQKNRAAAYVTDGGVRLHVKDDRYIRTTESRVKIQNAQPRGGGKGPGPGGI